MRALPVARPVAVVVLLAVLTVTIVGGTVIATPAAATASTATAASAVPTAVAGNSGAVGSAATLQESMDETTATPDNFTVTVETPSTIVANASLNYSVTTVGAEGNVTATWTFENETKEGKRVTHAFSEDGNATIEVTVTDEDGATVTKTLQVEVVEFGDSDDDRGTVRNLATFGLWMGIFFVLVFGFVLVLLPKGMQVITDAL